jgi:hypothetical protein
VNGADDVEEKQRKKAAPPAAAPKKAPAVEKKATKKAPAKKRVQKKVLFFLSNLFSVPLHTLQDEESGEDFAEDIDNVPADDEDEPPESDNKKRKVCLIFFWIWPSISCLMRRRSASCESRHY